MSDWAKLATRIATLPAPDVETDAMLWFALFKPEYRFPDKVVNRTPSDWVEAYERFHWDGGGGYTVTERLPRGTQSIDDALLIVERAMPGMSATCLDRAIKRVTRDGVSWASHSTDGIARAVLLAMLHFKQIA